MLPAAGCSAVGCWLLPAAGWAVGPSHGANLRTIPAQSTINSPTSWQPPRSHREPRGRRSPAAAAAQAAAQRGSACVSGRADGQQGPHARRAGNSPPPAGRWTAGVQPGRAPAGGGWGAGGWGRAALLRCCPPAAVAIHRRPKRRGSSRLIGRLGPQELQEAVTCSASSPPAPRRDPVAEAHSNSSAQPRAGLSPASAPSRPLLSSASNLLLSPPTNAPVQCCHADGGARNVGQELPWTRTCSTCERSHPAMW